MVLEVDKINDRQFFKLQCDLACLTIVKFEEMPMYISLAKPQNSAFLLLFLLAISCLTASNLARAGDDKSIQGKLRTDIINSMENYIANQTVDGKLLVFDAVQNKLLELTAVKLHKNIARDGEFFISCADYVDQQGHKVDLDFLVKTSGEVQVTTQTVVHAVDDMYRPYHVSDRNN